MTTPWISRPRWTCKYCNVTINDDVPSRTQHETGLRHKGNVERSLRDAYKKSERERAQDRANKHELDKIEKMAQKRHTEQDLASSSSSSQQQPETSTSASTATTRKTPQWKPKDKLAAYGSALPTYAEEQATLEEQRQQQWQEKQDERQKAGMAGEWQTITPVRVSSATADTSDTHVAASHVPAAPSAPQVREKQGNYRSDEEDGVGEIKVKKRTRAADEVERQRGMLPTWTPMRLDTGISAKQEGVQMVPVQCINDDRTETTVLDDDGLEEERKPLAAQGDPIDTPSASLFKKRRAGSGAGAKRVRAVI